MTRADRICSAMSAGSRPASACERWAAQKAIGPVGRTRLHEMRRMRSPAGKTALLLAAILLLCGVGIVLFAFFLVLEAIVT